MTKEQILLHNPMRSECLLNLEEHIIITANLARSIWLIFQNTDIDLSDQRNIEAISEIANIASDHATASRFCYLRHMNKETSNPEIYNGN